MEWNTLFSVALGGLIATLGSLLNNRFQSKERDKDRHEQRREAKTQLALELTRNDVKLVEEAIDYELKAMLIVTDFSLKRLDKQLSTDEMKEQLVSEMFDETGKLYQLGKDIIAEKIACTLGDDIYSEYLKLFVLTEEYWDLVVNNASVWDEREKQQDLHSKVISSAAKLHVYLKDKLISLRE